MEVGINFKNLISYNENMAKSLEDKLYFLDKLNIDSNKSYLFVDFGCADGTLINALYEILSSKGINAYYIGYDISDMMIDLSKTKSQIPYDCGFFTTSWDEVNVKVKYSNNMESVLILSSVIHEVYSYAKPASNDISVFWRRVKNTGFKYICVRDMMCSNDINRTPGEEICKAIKERCFLGSDMNKLKRSFEDRWCEDKNIFYNLKWVIHFLLKYRWSINWNREVNEDYFPIYINEFLEKFNKKYNIIYFKRFRVPFLEKCWKEDFDISIKDYTHIKAMFELSNNS